ncbi:saccharopine dehydrogenase [Nocardia sp. NPDC050713]|uniref:saccharopine dehydrogenase n=1 Tax=Nocardia sp. NPDC050713 TaxID=3154511 RepID=UPI0033DCD5AB
MSDALQFDAQGPVLLVGGYGVVGAEVARMAARSLPLLLTGRTPERGREVATETGAALTVWDLADPVPFRADVRAVVGLVNDPDDRILRAAIAGGVPFVDITRWTARLQRAATVAAMLTPAAPVLLSSAWMGGVTSLVAACLAHELGGADTVEVAIRWDLRDRAGADSIDFMDRFGLDYEVIENGKRRNIMPLSDTRRIRMGGTITRVARIDTPEQFTLPLTLDTRTAATRIGFDSAASTSALLALERLGFFRWGRGDNFTALRRAILRAGGEGGIARLRVDVTHGGLARSAVVTDPAGQAHLTAVGALLGLQRVLGLDGAPVSAGVTFPEQTPLPAEIPAMLAAHGVAVEIESATTGVAA